MNIAQLTHKSQLSINFPHYPSFTLTTQSKIWHFYSINQVTLRKKHINTHLIDFLTIQQNDYCLFLIKQIDYGRQNIAGRAPITVQKVFKRDLIGINTNKPSSSNSKQDKIIIDNKWKPLDYEKITLIRVPIITQSTQKIGIWSIYYSENIVKCQAPITQHMKQSLTNYCREILQIFHTNNLQQEEQIRQFQLIFQWNQLHGTIRILFIHNIVLKNTGRQYFSSNFKVGSDPYQRIQLQLKISDQQTPTKQFQQKQISFEEKRLKYLNFLKKLNNDKQNIIGLANIKKQAEIRKQFACTACHNYVKLGQNESQKMVTMNRIPQIQLLRQVKMKSKQKINYDLVPICSKCFQSFLMFCENNQNQQKQTKQNKKYSSKSISLKKSINVSSKQNTNYQPENNKIKWDIFGEKTEDHTVEPSQPDLPYHSMKMIAQKKLRNSDKMRKRQYSVRQKSNTIIGKQHRQSTSRVSKTRNNALSFCHNIENKQDVATTSNKFEVQNLQQIYKQISSYQVVDKKDNNNMNNKFSSKFIKNKYKYRLVH